MRTAARSALAAYTSARRALDEELGIDPSPALRRLEGAITAGVTRPAWPATCPS
jgi:DNA-binding SARP family transcriptional activator